MAGARWALTGLGRAQEKNSSLDGDGSAPTPTRTPESRRRHTTVDLDITASLYAEGSEHNTRTPPRQRGSVSSFLVAHQQAENNANFDSNPDPQSRPDSQNAHAAADIETNPRIPSPSFQPSYPSPNEYLVPVTSPRWSFRNAISSSWQHPRPQAPTPDAGQYSIYPTTIAPRNSSRRVRPRAGRLWNPTNSTPRVARLRPQDLPPQLVALQHPVIGGQGTESGEVGVAVGEYPLLTLSEQRASKNSSTGASHASLQVEYTSSNSGSNRISLPRSIELRHSTEIVDTEGKGKGRATDADAGAGDENKSVYRRSTSGPPVALDGRRERKKLNRELEQQLEKGKGKAREVESGVAFNITMASPTFGHDVEASPFPQDEYDHRTSMGEYSGIGPALSSDGSSQHGTDVGVIADVEWGPQHPCYPHLNPYVPTTSHLYQSTRIIRIRRDWMIAGDLAPTFSGLYPEILQDAGLGEGEFRRVVESVNTKLIDIYKPWAWANVIDAFLGLLTGWLWDDLGLTYAKRKLKLVERELEVWNEEQEKRATSRAENARRQSKGLRSLTGMSGMEVEEEGVQAKFITLRKSGYLSLDIQIPTPRIGEVEVEENADLVSDVDVDEGERAEDSRRD